MKNELLLWWDTGKGGNITNPDFGDIEKALRDAWNTSGSVTVWVRGDAYNSDITLQARIDRKMAIVTLGADTEDDYEVRSFSGDDVEGEVDILGDSWPLSQICKNYSVIYEIFKEFYAVGDVSTQFLN